MLHPYYLWYFRFLSVIYYINAACNQGLSQPNTAGKAKKNLGAEYLSSFFLIWMIISQLYNIQNNAQCQAKRTLQYYISRREKQRGVWGRQPPEVNGGLGTEPVAIMLLFFSKKYTFLGIFWSKFIRKNAFLNSRVKCVDAPRRPLDLRCCATGGVGAKPLWRNTGTHSVITLKF